MSEPNQTDAAGVLLDQHAEIRRLFADVEQRRGEPRREAFEQLVRLLAVHETAEQEVLHPQVRLLVAGGQEITDARLEEERHAKELLAQLDELGPEVDDFDQRLDAVRKAVLDHAAHEERDEFPRLRDALSPAQLEAMGMAVRVAEATAPTHPHPRGELSGRQPGGRAHAGLRRPHPRPRPRRLAAHSGCRRRRRRGGAEAARPKAP